MTLVRYLALAFACSTEVESPSYPQVFREALTLAAAGDPAAWRLCETLEVGKGRGECKLEASQLMPDRAAACDSIIRDHWRNECWFEYAEDLATEQRWDAAIEACESADEYTGHCARHLWWTSLVAGREDPALRARLASAFPEYDAEIQKADADYRALSATMGKERATPADHTVARSDTELEWERTFRAAGRVDTALCDDNAACLKAARSVYTDRWRRVRERNPQLAADLCAGIAPSGRLDPGNDATLTALAATLRASDCPAPAK